MKVTVFKPYQFKVGQKIRIDGSNRNGDREVIGTGDNKVTLKCPVSGKEFTWQQFCYLAEDDVESRWPQE